MSTDSGTAHGEAASGAVDQPASAHDAGQKRSGEVPRPPRSYDPRRKSPTVAGLLSLMPGLGQVYMGYYQRGFAHAAVFVLMIGILSSGAEELEPIFGPLLGFFMLYNIIDAVRRASAHNHALDGLGPMPVPDAITLGGPGGTIVGGSILAMLGFVLLLHLRFDVSLSWLREWWPLGVIGFGLYLLVRGLRERNSGS
jgi:hypothetical protein